MHSYQELKTEFLNQKKLENNENLTINTESIKESVNDANKSNSMNKATNNDIMLSLSAITSTDINNKKKLKDFFKTIKAGGKQGYYHDRHHQYHYHHYHY
jgi:hypothetical protein